ncbi:interactor of HORMAD1 protein 1 [Periophthalmus magnuspinnatus]|uniref:interactor of HORMAD1 protein 1 n=1 Tax=Periophthalmus magnuspinnatus TaxID=409849 RepID=UPI002436B4C8|nr:interactor of HORMAD1 protein 1 [Periophthalmus magnuspinnatus]
MSHMRSLTEMMTIANGNRTINASGHSVTDSQFFFGSQFWPENSASQSLSLSSWNSTQSQEDSDSTLLRTYQSKPLLFSETKDKSKLFSLLDKFEEDKKKTKKNSDSEALANEYIHIRETLNKIHQLATGTEKNSVVCYTVLEKIEHFVSTLQNNLISLQSDISLQLQTLLDNVNSQKETVTGLEDKMEKTTTNLSCSVLSLMTNVDGLKKDQKTERDMLEEALKLLSALLSKNSPKRSQVTVMDSFIQTSPSLTHALPGSLQENQLERTQPDAFGKADAPKENRVCVGKRKPKRLSVRRKKRPLVMAQNHKPAVPLENSPSLLNGNKLSLSECHNKNGSKSFITPMSCWSQDSNSSACLNGIDPILDRAEASAQPGGLWQLFELDF